MDEQLAVARNVALQREWYGESLGDRVRRLVVAFDCSQAQLAEVLGLSAPMLSQLMSGRRAKIGNPAVLARMVMLERRVLTPEVASGDPAAIRAALEEVRDSRPTVSRPTGGRSASGLEILPVEERGDWNNPDVNNADVNPDVLVEALRAVVAPAELAAAAGLLREQCPQLARVLRNAAGTEAGGSTLDGAIG
ncbi:MAG TPA: helix-turn-helix transcriptional regulator [Pseudonocardiaceae bacterium]